MIRGLFMLLMVTCIGLCAAGQSDSGRGDHYLLKSRKQQKAAVITAGCSVAVFLPGVIMLNNVEPGWERLDWGKALGGTALVAVGTGLAITSAVLFIASGNNRKRAESVSVFINRPVSVNMGRAVTVLPYSVGVTIAVK
ncbi:MAG: hypothetical protein KA821_17620 [Chitinophagaceae bacterium]|nr:hypothetical protein [Chitinophagaceae bacterium]